MLYDAYEVQRSFLASASKLAGMGAGWLNNPSNPWGYSSMGPMVDASLEVFAHASAPRGKPEFGLNSIRVGRKDVPNVSQAEGLLDLVMRGLGDVAKADQPRVKVWPSQLSNKGFAPTFARQQNFQ